MRKTKRIISAALALLLALALPAALPATAGAADICAICLADTCNTARLSVLSDKIKKISDSLLAINNNDLFSTKDGKWERVLTDFSSVSVNEWEVFRVESIPGLFADQTSAETFIRNVHEIIGITNPEADAFVDKSLKFDGCIAGSKCKMHACLTCADLDVLCQAFYIIDRAVFLFLDANAVTVDKAALTWSVIQGSNTAEDNVTANLAILPATGVNGATISWSSSKAAVISNTGTVTRPPFGKGDTAVTLTATISKGTSSDTVVFNLTVKESAQSSSISGDVSYSPENLSGSFTGSNSVYVKESGKPFVFTAQKSFSLFRDVRINGNTLTRNTHYSAKSGSTEITLSADYLDTLPIGKHTLEVRFTDNTSAKAEFTIVNAPGPVTPVLPVNPFEDVQGADWFIDAVIYVYDKGLMSGTRSDPMLFSPSAPLTRAMAATVLYRMQEAVPSIYYANPFDDVGDSAWYADAVKWAYHNGIVTGVSEDIFAPDANITRQDLAVLLMRYMNFLEINIPVTMQWIIFSDEAEISGYAMGAIQTLNKLGVINGTGTDGEGQTIINPKGQASRAEFSAMLMRFAETVQK